MGIILGIQKIFQLRFVQMSKKKCPVCGSSRTEENEKGFFCKKCGFENRAEIERRWKKNGLTELN